MSKTLLIVDDNADDSEMLTEACIDTLKGANVIVASNGQEALDILSRTPQQPHLVFLDLNMPKMNGIQCLEKIKQTNNFSQIPVVIYTTSNQAEDREQCEKLGANDYLVKPSSFRGLKKDLEDIFARFGL